jgi:hypothetical protein
MVARWHFATIPSRTRWQIRRDRRTTGSDSGSRGSVSVIGVADESPSVTPATILILSFAYCGSHTSIGRFDELLFRLCAGQARAGVGHPAANVTETDTAKRATAVRVLGLLQGESEALEMVRRLIAPWFHRTRFHSTRVM